MYISGQSVHTTKHLHNFTAQFIHAVILLCSSCPQVCVSACTCMLLISGYMTEVNNDTVIFRVVVHACTQPLILRRTHAIVCAYLVSARDCTLPVAVGLVQMCTCLFVCARSVNPPTVIILQSACPNTDSLRHTIPNFAALCITTYKTILSHILLHIHCIYVSLCGFTCNSHLYHTLYHDSVIVRGRTCVL